MPSQTYSYSIDSLAGGANLRDPPHRLPANDAYYINGYRCFEKSLKAVGKQTAGPNLGDDVRVMHVTQTSAFADILIACTDSSINSITSAWAETDITGAMTVTNGLFSGINFNSYLILCNGTDPVIKVDGTPTCSTAGFVGPSGADTALEQVWAHQNRLYFTQKNSNSFWWGGRNSISGTLKEYPLQGIFKRRGKLLFGTTWSTNQGSNAESLTILVSDAGEVLIYTGDYPDSNTWRLLSRIEISKPIGKNSYVNIGGDVAIYTQNGPILLSQAISSPATPAALFKLTDKISGTFRRLSYPAAGYGVMSVDTKEPFLYIMGAWDSREYRNSGQYGGLWCQNLNTGAWSFISINDGSAGPISMTFAFGTLVFGFASGKTYYLLTPFLDSEGYSGCLGLSNRYIESGWLDLGTQKQKKITGFRIYVSNDPNYDLPTDTIYAKTTYAISLQSDLVVLNPFFPRANNWTYYPILENGKSIGEGVVPLYSTNISCLNLDGCGAEGRYFKLTIINNSSVNNQIDEIFNIEIDYTIGGPN